MKKILLLTSALTFAAFHAQAADSAATPDTAAVAAPKPTPSKLATHHARKKHQAEMAAADAADPFEAQDPLRPFNEAIFSFNLGADTYVIHPIAQGYHALPEVVRYGASNFFTNLGEPLSAVNSLAQLDFQAFGTTLFRFLLNTTFGLAGMRDFAGENGLVENDQSFNQTLKTYGVGTGPYLVLPLLGPSSVRGTTGKVVDWFADPVGYYVSTPVSIGQATAEGIITRDENDAIINQMYYESLDPYTAARAAYLQHGAVGSDGVSPGVSE